MLHAFSMVFLFIYFYFNLNFTNFHLSQLWGYIFTNHQKNWECGETLCPKKEERKKRTYSYLIMTSITFQCSFSCVRTHLTSDYFHDWQKQKIHQTNVWTLSWDEWKIVNFKTKQWVQYKYTENSYNKP